MSRWKIELDHGTGWVELTDYNGRSLVRRDSISLVREAHNRGKSVISTFGCDLVGPPEALIVALYQTPTYEPAQIRVEKDGYRIFTGYVRPVDSYTAQASERVIEREIAIEAVDVLWMLQRELTARFKRVENTLGSIVHELIQAAGVDASQIDFLASQLPQVVNNVNEEASDREILAIIDDLLFEYHHCLQSTAEGKYTVFNWKDSGATPVGTFSEFIDAISAEKTDDDYGYVVASYKQAAQIDSFEVAGTRWNPVGQWGGESGPSELKNPDTGVDIDVQLKLAETLPDGSDIVAIEDGIANFAVQPTKNSSYSFRWEVPVDGVAWLRTAFNRTQTLSIDTVTTATFNDEDDTLDLTFRLSDDVYAWGTGNSVSGWSRDFIIVFLWGVVKYERRAGEVRAATAAAGSPNARRVTHESDYLYNATDAETFAESYLNLLQYGSRLWTVRSATLVGLGDVVTIDAGPLGLNVRGRVLRINESESNATRDGYQEYVYTIEALDAATATNNSTAPQELQIPAIPPPSIVLEDRPTFGDLDDGVTSNGPIEALPAPALSASATTRKASLAIGYDVSIVSGSLRAELQISDNDTDWFSLGPGGNGPDDWKATADEVTRIVGMSYTHDQLPLGGDAGNPLQTTYYYRARIVAGSLVSDWSTSTAVVVSPVLEGDIGAESVTANKIAANAITAASIAAGAVTADKLTVDDLAATGATIAGWKILTEMLASDDDTVLIRRDKKRFEIVDTLGNVKAAFGFLDGIDDLGPNDYGLWIASGNVIHIEGGGSFDAGDYSIGSDAAYVVLDGVGNEIVRLGSMGFGNVGARIGDPINGQGLSYETATNTLTVAGRIIIKDIVIDEEQGLSGLSADRQRRLEISSEKLEWYEVQDGVERKVAELSDRADTRAVRFTQHVRVGTLGGLPAGTVAYYDCNDGVPIGSREGGLIEITDTGATLSGYSKGTAVASNNNLIMGG